MTRPTPILRFAIAVLASAAFGQPAPVHPGAATFRITGTVLSSVSEQPLSRASVSIANSEDRQAFRAVEASRDGTFSFAGLAAGKYQILVRCRGYRPSFYREHAGFFTGVVVGPDSPEAQLVFRMEAEASISGNIIDEAGDPVRDARVYLFHDAVEYGKRSTHIAGTVTTDDEGTYRLPHLVPGRYFVVVTAEPWYAQHGVVRRTFNPGVMERLSGVSAPESPEQPNPELDVAYPVLYYPGATEPDGAEPIQLHPGEHAVADMALHPVRALHVRLNVPGPADENVNAIVQERLFGDYKAQIGSSFARTDGQGRELLGTAPGDYTISVTRFSRDGRQATSAPVNVRLSEEGNNSLDIGKPSIATVSGTLTLPDRNGSGARVALEGADQSGTSARVDADGHFEFPQPTPPGRYEVRVQGRGALAVATLKASGAKVIGQKIEISGAEPIQLEITAVRGNGTISGIVVSDGKPLAGACVVLIPAAAEDESLYRADQSDSDGSFNLRAVIPGKYTLIAIADGWEVEWQNRDVAAAYLKDGVPVVVSADGKYSFKVTAQAVK